MRMHHQKTGGNRNAGRNTVSVSVAVLLALVMLAAGVCGGFLLTREPEPAAFESTTRAGTLVVQSEPYDDERSVTVTVERSESGSVAAPVGGSSYGVETVRVREQHRIRLRVHCR